MMNFSYILIQGFDAEDVYTKHTQNKCDLVGFFFRKSKM